MKNFSLICASLSLAAIAWPVSINEWTKVFKTCQVWLLDLEHQAAIATYENSPEGKAKRDKEELSSAQRGLREAARRPHNIALPNGDIYTVNGYILHPNGDWNLPPAGFRPPQDH